MEKKTAYARTQMDVIVFDEEDVIATSTCDCHGQVHVTVCTSDNTSSCTSDSFIEGGSGWDIPGSTTLTFLFFY